MSQEKITTDYLTSILGQTISTLNFDALSVAGRLTNEAKAASEDKAKEEESAFDAPTKDDTDQIQDLASVSLDFKFERDQITLKRLNEKVESFKAKTKNYNAIARGRKIDNRLRLQMANATFKFMQLWCSFVALIVFLYVAKNEGNPPPSVIIALLGTSTISIVGLVGFVVSGLFKASSETINKDKSK
jgi:hypothetical protein